MGRERIAFAEHFYSDDEPRDEAGRWTTRRRRIAFAERLYSEDQPRDESGKWVSEGGGGYPYTGSTVSGLSVKSEIPNQASIDASLENYTVLPGVREVPMSDFPGITGKSYSRSENERIAALAESIKSSGEIAPLIVVQEREGPYILEGGHRIDALFVLGILSFPALVVINDDDPPEGFSIASRQGEKLAALRGTGPTKRRKWESAVNDYQKELGQTYTDWADDTADELDAATPEEADDVLDEALVVLAGLLTALGRKNITAGGVMALGRTAPTPDYLDDLSNRIEDNEGYIKDSLIPDIRNKLSAALYDPDVVATGAAAFLGLLAAYQSRVESYAGGMWSAMQAAQEPTADAAAEEGFGRVAWERDPDAKSCDDCLEFGDVGFPGRIYDSWADMADTTGDRLPGEVQCGANDRCTLWVETGPDEWTREGFASETRGEKLYSDDEPRDEAGRWTSMGGGDAASTAGGGGQATLNRLPSATTRAGLKKIGAMLEPQVRSDPEFRAVVLASLQYTSGGFDPLENAAAALMQGDPQSWRQAEYDKRDIPPERQEEGMVLAGSLASENDNPLIPIINEAVGNEGVRLENGELVGTGEPSDFLEAVTIGNAESGAKALLGAIANSPETEIPIYRGLHIRSGDQEQFRELLTPGKSIVLGLESFTNKENVAISFAEGRGGGMRGAKGSAPWIIETVGPRVGLNVSALSTWPQQAEVLTSGRFTVESVTYSRGEPGVQDQHYLEVGGGRIVIRQEAVYDPSA